MSKSVSSCAIFLAGASLTLAVLSKRVSLQREKRGLKRAQTRSAPATTKQSDSRPKIFIYYCVKCKW